ncbi:hypothetical protein BN439_3309 [Erwinia amylovora Ea644]|uniref:hypothetical protein n=1 Tax=Erwinia amylovora TaxID=552 RepID=UPI0002CC5818|nr:hypothetical protein [Erwinia amylovora]CCP04336.1 hypothetical protein BN439_3309 [Erwinia amylovora Ea644]
MNRQQTFNSALTSIRDNALRRLPGPLEINVWLAASRDGSLPQDERCPRPTRSKPGVQAGGAETVC